jgi:hypothetical protein
LDSTRSGSFDQFRYLACRTLPFRLPSLRAVWSDRWLPSSFRITGSFRIMLAVRIHKKAGWPLSSHSSELRSPQ